MDAHVTTMSATASVQVLKLKVQLLSVKAKKWKISQANFQCDCLELDDNFLN